MRRSDLVRKLRKLHGELRPNLLAAGIEEAKADAFLTTIDDASDDAIAAYTDKLAALRDGAYKAFMTVWGLKDPAWWQNMAMLGETDLREHRLLRPLAKDLRVAWKAMNRKARKPAPVTETPVESV